MIPIHSTIIPIAKIVSAIHGLDKRPNLILIYTTSQLPQAISPIAGYSMTGTLFRIMLLSAPELYLISRGLMYFTGDHTQRMKPIFASLIMAAAPMVCIYLFAHEYIQSGMLSGAVKG
jgi:raffinose/stachyose/melibiose transport system permease protein